MDRTNWWLSRVVLEWTVIIVMTFATWYCWWLLPIALMVVGSRQHALVILGHAGAHWHVSMNKSFNDLLTRLLCFLPLGIDLDKYRRFHFAHHQHLGSSYLDPEVEIVEKFRDRWSGYRLSQSVRDMLGWNFMELMSILKHTLSFESFGVIAVAAILAGCVGAIPLVVLWFASSITGLMVVHRLRAWTEHNHLEQPGVTFKTDRPSWFKRYFYLSHSTWLHLEHHAAPGIPLQYLG